MRIIIQLFAIFRDALGQAALGTRRIWVTVWRTFRQELLARDQEIARLQCITLSVPSSPVDPPSSSQIAVNEAAAQRAAQEVEAAEFQTTAGLERLTQAHAEETLATFKCPKSKLGCLIPEEAPTHPNGYRKVNLRHTLTRVPGQTDYIGHNVNLHQIAMVEAGRLAEAKATGTHVVTNSRFDHQRWHISPLYHIGRCVNHAHLVVEPGRDNQDRQACKGPGFLCLRGIQFGIPARLHPQNFILYFCPAT